MDNIYKFVGAKVREERKRLKLTQEELAEKADITANFLGHIERGGKQASLETIAKLARALNIPYVSFFGGCEYPQEKQDSLLKKINILVKDKNPSVKKKILKLIKIVS